jgi:manganese-dependent inorganic pyrophosphatase
MYNTSVEKRVYVIGHKNPDTDSVVSAAAYARLKQIQGQHGVIAARAGKISPQTEYIFERFGVSVPEYLPDLIPKAEYYISGELVTVNEKSSVWEALEQLQKDDSRVLLLWTRQEPIGVCSTTGGLPTTLLPI